MMFFCVSERSTEDLHNTEKSDNIEKLDNVKKDTPPNKKRKVDDTAAVKMGLGNVHVPVDLDPLEAAHLTDWAANFNSSLLGPSTPPHSSDMPNL